MVDKLRVQASLARVITQELKSADGDGNGRLSQAERATVNGFIRTQAKTGDDRLAAIKDRTMTAAMTLWAKHNTGDKAQLTDAEIKAITKDDPLLGELTKRAVLMAKQKPQPSDKITLEPLSTSHKLRKLAEKIAESWGDANITSSSINVTSGRIKGFAQIDKTQGHEKREAALRAATVKIFKETYESEEEQPLTKNKQGMQYGEWEKALPSMMKAVADDGYCYAPENKDDRKALEKDIKKMILASGAKYPIVCEVKERLPYTDGEKRNVSTFLISDIDSGEYIAIYVREGTM